MAAVDTSALVSALNDLLSALKSGHARKNALNTQTLQKTTLETVLTNAKTLVSKGDVGLALVENLSMVTKELAEAATASDVYMTPLGTKQLLDAMKLASQLASNQSKLLDLQTRMTKLESGSSGGGTTAARTDVGTESMLRFTDKKKQVIAAGALAPYGLSGSPLQAQNAVYFIPVIFPRDVKVVQMGLVFSKTGSTDMWQEIGLYASDGSNTGDKPGTPLFNGRLTPAAVGVGLLTLPTPVTLKADTLYWVGFAGNGNDVFIKHMDSSFTHAMLGGNNAVNGSNYPFLKAENQNLQVNPAISATARSASTAVNEASVNLTVPLILLHETLYTA